MKQTEDVKPKWYVSAVGMKSLESAVEVKVCNGVGRAPTLF